MIDGATLHFFAKLRNRRLVEGQESAYAPNDRLTINLYF